MKRHWMMLGLAAALAGSLGGCAAVVAGGAATGVLAASDRRTGGAQVDDQGIELKARRIGEKIPAAHVNVTAYNRAVLMTGEVPTEAARAEAELIVRAIPNVRQVYNYTEVAPASSFAARNGDTWITTKVRTNLLQAQGFSPNHVKVVTERGVTYLMGLLTPSEAEAAARQVSQTAGVQKVVTLFETISEIQP
ncbi:osmotically-inducible protein OsmY [Crenobacter luteus]|uniref:Hemolysin n=1 Tax=Crenobacter luteus TaxID=1452487 RepID=A0A165FKS1_9NEIS|nr:BON domain-containing protein [Crenobacter luteus]KZE33574.1 hemolysin [Crenobacter luteus]TCP12989.1 osmotically-inducible protein OsmY [Crenobacter luteus]